MSARIIINAAIGSPAYLKGQKRLHNSLVSQGYNGTVGMFDSWPISGYDRKNRYNIKAACIEYILRQNQHRYIVWMDASVVAVSNVDPLFDEIERKGYYLGSSGYKASHTCTDAQLKAAGIDRTQAEDIPDTATGCFGIDMQGPKRQFLLDWVDWAKAGLFSGDRLHNKADSEDPRYYFGRQDQSAATLLAHIHNMPLDYSGLSQYWPPTETAVVAYKEIS